MEKSVAFYEGAIGLEITNKIEEEKFREVILGTADGARIQLAYHFDETGPIEHTNAFWKHYVYTDDCKGLFERAIAGGGASVLEPQRLERWNVTVAMVSDPDGYQLEIIQNDG
jgi:lactoylglutathione lyase